MFAKGILNSEQFILSEECFSPGSGVWKDRDYPMCLRTCVREGS